MLKGLIFQGVARRKLKQKENEMERCCGVLVKLLSHCVLGLIDATEYGVKHGGKLLWL